MILNRDFSVTTITGLQERVVRTEGRTQDLNKDPRFWRTTDGVAVTVGHPTSGRLRGLESGHDPCIIRESFTNDLHLTFRGRPFSDTEDNHPTTRRPRSHTS